MKTDTSSESLRTPSDAGHEDFTRKRLFSTRLNEFQPSELKKRYKMDHYVKGVEKNISPEFSELAPVAQSSGSVNEEEMNENIDGKTDLCPLLGTSTCAHVCRSYIIT